MELSIIIPIFNTECDKLRRCFDSICGIGKISFECILIDDGSDEKVGVFCRNYIDGDDRFRYYRKENGGVSSARNMGICMAKGQYVCFVDSDDAILPEAYNMPGLLDDAYDLIITDLLEVNGGRKNLWKAFAQAGEISYESAVKRLVQDGSWNGPYCKFIKRSFVERAGVLFDVDMIQGEDTFFVCQILKQKPKMRYVDIVSYLYYHSYSHSNRRFVCAPIACTTCMAQNYYEVLQCIQKGSFSENESMDLKSHWKDLYIQGLLGRALDGIEYGVATCDLQRVIQESAEPLRAKESGRLNTSAKLKLMVLRIRNWHVLKIMAFIRTLYHKAKGFR